MVRILIVDDEEIVLASSKKLIQSNLEDILIETAQNAREAMIKMDQFRPQIIMTDIKMPGMNGLEFIERIRKQDQQSKIIIASAYDHFEYAKEAVKYDVEEYVLKPLTKQKLIDVIQTAMRKIDEEAEKRHSEIDHMERFYQSVGLVESNFFNSIALNRNYMKHIIHYRALLDIALEKGYFACIEFSSLDFSASMEAINAYHQKINTCSEDLKTRLKFNISALVSSPFLNRIFIYAELDSRDKGMPFWQQLQQELMERFGLRLRIGIGSVEAIADISASYEASMLVLRQSDDAVATLHGNVETVSTAIFDQAFLDLYEDFYTKRKRFKPTLRLFEFEFMKLLKNSSTLGHAEASLVELYILIRHLCFASNVITPARYHDKGDLLTLINKTPVAKIQHFERVVNEHFELYSRIRRGEYNDITLAAVEKIQKRFKTEISLEALADEIKVTPQYLSKLIKDDTGITFKEYINELRIEEAKKQLRQPDSSIKTVGFDVGYNDTSYFIRTFKKYEGITPRDYQRMVRG
jgi:two-component system response regulator YesN